MDIVTIEGDDEQYPHNDKSGFGLKIDALDDQGLQISLRVDNNFFCANFSSKDK